MTTKTFYRDVEFNVEIEYTIKATSDVVNFDHTKKEIEKVTISGKNIEKATHSFSEAVGFDLTTEQMLAVAFSDVDTMRDLVNGHTDSPAKDIFSNAFAKFVFRAAGESDDLHIENLLSRSLHWSMRGDSKYKDKFLTDLNFLAENLGYIKMPV